MKKPQRYWFVNKRFGWGWRPATWQGWVALAIYVLLLIGVFVTFDYRSNMSAWQVTSGVVLPTLGFTFILIGVCVWTGEKPTWHSLKK